MKLLCYIQTTEYKGKEMCCTLLYTRYLKDSYSLLTLKYFFFSRLSQLYQITINFSLTEKHRYCHLVISSITRLFSTLINSYEKNALF